MTNVVWIDYVDPGVQGEYGFFGSRVANSYVRGLSEAERAAEREAMLDIVGRHCVAVEVEEVPAVS